MKAFLSLMAAFSGVSAMAGEVISCVGQDTQAQTKLEINRKRLLSTDLEYRFDGKRIGIDQLSFSIDLEPRKEIQTLSFLFETKRTHKLGRKGSILAFAISQPYTPGTDPLVFKLHPQYKAELYLKVSKKRFERIDQLNCRTE